MHLDGFKMVPIQLFFYVHTRQTRQVPLSDAFILLREPPADVHVLEAKGEPNVIVEIDGNKLCIMIRSLFEQDGKGIELRKLVDDVRQSALNVLEGCAPRSIELKFKFTPPEPMRGMTGAFGGDPGVFVLMDGNRRLTFMRMLKHMLKKEFGIDDIAFPICVGRREVTCLSRLSLSSHRCAQKLDHASSHATVKGVKIAVPVEAIDLWDFTENRPSVSFDVAVLNARYVCTDGHEESLVQEEWSDPWDAAVFVM